MDYTDAQLEAALRRPQPTLADDGFTQRVLAQLPRPAHAKRARRWTLGVSAAVATALVAWLASPLEGAFIHLTPVASGLLPVITVLFAALIAVPCAAALRPH